LFYAVNLILFIEMGMKRLDYYLETGVKVEKSTISNLKIHLWKMLSN